MKVLSFLGTGQYEEVTYIWGKKKFKTPFFLEAINEWLQPQSIVLLRTDETQIPRKDQQGNVIGPSNWELISTKMGETLSAVDIPSGQNEAELWQIFDSITEHMEEDEELIVDITHAFRSLPLLSLLAIVYLRQVKRIKLKNIVYGAFTPGKDIAQTFDLTPFIDLLDWAYAARQFTQTGIADELASMISKQAQTPPLMQNIATQLKRISQALMLNRPAEIKQNSTELNRLLDQLISPSESTSYKPFSLLLNTTRSTFFGNLAKPNLQSEKELIFWYAKHNHLVQAVGMSREWIVSVLLESASLKYPEENQLRSRYDAEFALQTFQQLKQKNKPKKLKKAQRTEPFSSEELYQEKSKDHQAYLDAQALEDWNVLTELWIQVADLRNDLLHFGHRETPLKIEKIQTQVEKFIKNLKDFIPTIEQNHP